MVKIVFCLRRRPNLTREAFQQYWRTSHALLVIERAKLLGITRYVQTETLFDPALAHIAGQRGITGEAFDGVAELWFGAAEGLHARSDAPAESLQAARDLLKDEARFIDLPNSLIFVAREHEILRT